MGAARADRVKETSVSTGTGNFTLAGAVTGHQAFDSAWWVSDGDTVNYLIEAVDSSGVPTGAWEVGLGTWTAGVLTRTTVYDNGSQGTTPVNFAAGLKHVSVVLSANAITTMLRTLNHVILSGATATVLSDYDNTMLVCTYAAGAKTITVPPNSTGAFPQGFSCWVFNAAAFDVTLAAGAGVTLDGNSLVLPAYSSALLVKQSFTNTWRVLRVIEPGQWGALVKKAADETGADYSTATAVAWDAEVRDTHAIHNNVTNNTRMLAPTGAKRVRLRTTIELANNTANNWVEVRIKKNGAAFDGQAGQVAETGATTPILSCETAEVAVTGGTDYFEVFLRTQDTAVDVVAAGSWFELEVVA